MGSMHEFLRRTGFQSANLAAYLVGSKPILWKRLQTATREVLAEPPAIIPQLEQYRMATGGRLPRATLQGFAGVYAFFDSAMSLLYFGKTTKDLYAEVNQTLARDASGLHRALSGQTLSLRDVTTFVSAYRFERADDAMIHDIEVLVLRLIVNCTLNANGGRFRRTR